MGEPEASTDALQADMRCRQDCEGRRRRVTILYKTMPHYRAEFFERLRVRLMEDGVDLELVVGQPEVTASKKHDTAYLEWAKVLHNRYFRVGRRHLVWQPALGILRSADLVIVEQASRLLVNPFLAVWRTCGGPRFALWGHGKNLDPSKASRVGEWWKRKTMRSCDWWFAYTEGTARLVEGSGFPRNRITVVQNAIDTAALTAQTAAISISEIAKTKRTLGISSDHVAMFVGSLYDGKRLPFLIQAADLVRDRLTDFELLIIGDGPERAIVEDAASTRPWIHVLGALFGKDLARCAAVSSVTLMPGIVGLAILDSFAFCLPTITSNVSNHSPEVEYLRDGWNGLMVADWESAQAYARAVDDYFRDRDLQDRLKRGCRESATRYTVDEMVERFRSGVLKGLQQ